MPEPAQHSAVRQHVDDRLDTVFDRRLNEYLDDLIGPVDDRGARDNGFVWPDLIVDDDPGWSVDYGSSEHEHVFDHLET